jgi:hypothetical protein
MNSLCMAQALALSLSSMRTMHAYGLVDLHELRRAVARVRRARLWPTTSSIGAAWATLNVMARPRRRPRCL